MNDLRVLVIADDPLARAGVATMLADQPECAVVAQVGAADGDLAALLDVQRPDVVVWDLGWDPSSAIDRMLDIQDFDIPIVALLPDETPTSEVWAAGARGLLLREADAEGLLAAAKAVFRGIAAIDPRLAQAVLPDGDRAPSPPIQELTPRELEVLRLLAEGLPNKSIAHRLDISEHTVKFHVNSILAKLNAHSRTEAVVQGMRLGLVLL